MRQCNNYVIQTNLSEAWLEVFRQLMEPGVNKISPLIVTITDFSYGRPVEDSYIRQTLDAALRNMGKRSCQTVASTIFPSSLWNWAKDRDVFFDRYRRILPQIKKDPANKYGIYSERLISFGSKKEKQPPVNQLEHIIQTYERGNHRHSALQAAIFDPRQDHTDQRQRGFPCLQQVAFDANSRNRELIVTGFYAKQYIFDKAYGNYLGLCALGEFMAHEMGLELKQVICIANVAELGIAKGKAQSLLNKFVH